MKRYNIRHERFGRVANKLMDLEPPCMSEAQDWETENAVLAEIMRTNAVQSATAAPPDLNGKLNEGLADFEIERGHC